MKKLAIFVLLLLPASLLAQNSAVNGFCDQGAAQATTSGLMSTNYLQGVVPTCTVTVYLTGTTTPATIFSNSTGTALTNPFKAAFNGQYLFYAANTVGLDVVLSGGNYPNFYPAPVTITDVIPGGNGGGGGGGVTQIIAGSNINITPTGGTGIVTINSAGGNLGNSTPGQFIVNSNGAVSGVTSDTDIFQDNYRVAESGGVYTATNGVQAYGDSNMIGFGLPGGLGWAARLTTLLNLPFSAGPGCRGATFPLTGGTGDNSADIANRLVQCEYPMDTGNPAIVIGIGTNNTGGEGSTTPTTAHQISYTAQTALMQSWGATGASAKFMGSVTTATATNCSVLNGVATVAASNQFVGGMVVTLSGFTNCTSFNTINGGIVTISPGATPTQYQFATTASNQASGADTGIATPSNTWTFPTGTWAYQQPQAFFGYGGGSVTGAGYKVGNLLTWNPGGEATPETFTVIGTPGGGFGTGLSVTVTVDGGGHPNAVTSFTGGTGYLNLNAAQIQCGSNDSYVQTGVSNIITGVPVTVSILVAGSGGCSAGTYTTSTTGSLSNSNLQLTTLGGRQPSSAAAGLTCANGTASSCGAGTAATLFNGPNAMYTTTGGTATISGLAVPQSSTVGGVAKGHVILSYMVGPNNTGSISVTGSASGALTDSITGLVSLPETNAGGFAPNNFQTGATMNAADFAVNPGTQSFTINCGPNCGFMALTVLPSTHNTGDGVPTVVWNGIIHRGGNIGEPTCGLALPQSCVTFYTQLGFTETETLASEGLRVKPVSQETVSPITGFYNGAGNPLIQGCVANSDTVTHEHMDSCAQNIFTENDIQALKLIANPSSLINASSVTAKTLTGTVSVSSPGILYTFSNLGTGQYSGFANSAQQLSGIPSFGLATTSANIGFTSVAGQASLALCDQPAVANTAVTMATLIATGTCRFDFNAANFEIGAMGLATIGGNFSSATISSKSSAYNAGIAFTQSSVGSGYTNVAGTVTATGQTCTFQPNVQGVVVSGGLTIQVLSAGVCSVAPTGFTVSGFGGGGTGAAGTFSLAATAGFPGSPYVNWSTFDRFTTDASGRQYPTHVVKETSFSPLGGIGRVEFLGPNNAGVGWFINNTGSSMLDNDLSALTASRIITWPDLGGTPMLALTTTGTTGVATFSGGTLNIPNYSAGASGVSSINTVAGAFTFTGGGVSCTSTTCTFSGTGSGVTSVAMTVPSSLLTISGSPITSSGTLAVGLASVAADTVLGNPTNSSATPIFMTMPNCSGSANALTWAGLSGFGCNTWPFQSLTTVGQSGPSTLSGGVLNIPQYSTLVNIQAAYPGSASLGAKLAACLADATVLGNYTCDATAAVQTDSASSTAASWTTSGSVLVVNEQNNVVVGDQIHAVFGTTSALTADYTITARTATSWTASSAASASSGTEAVSMYPLKLVPIEVAKTQSQIIKWPSGGVLYDETPSTTLATPSAPTVTPTTGTGSLPAATYLVTVNYRSGDAVSASSSETSQVLSSTGELTITGPASCPTYAQGYDVNITSGSTGTETLQGNAQCGTTLVFARAALFPSTSAQPTVATGVPAFIFYNINKPVFYAESGANGAFVIRTGPGFNASNILATGTKGYSTFANITAYNFQHVNMTGAACFDSAFFTGSIRYNLNCVGTGGTTGNHAVGYKIYGTANDVSWYASSASIQDTFGTPLLIQRTPATYGDTEGMGRLNFYGFTIVDTTSTDPLINIQGLGFNGTTNVTGAGLSGVNFFGGSFETNNGANCASITDAAGVNFNGVQCQSTSFTAGTKAYLIASTAGSGATYTTNSINVVGSSVGGFPTVYQNNINSASVTVPNNNFPYSGDYHYGGGQIPTDVWQSRPVTSDSTLVLSASGALTLSAMTGTSCLEEISGVVTATGSACGGGSGNTTSTSLTTNFIPKANGANSIINSLLDDGATTANTLSYSGTGGIAATGGPLTSAGDGVHAGNASVVGNTTVPTLPTGTFSLIGPNNASVTAFGWQAPTATNGSAGIAHVGANSAGISQLTVSAISLTADVTGILAAANGGSGVNNTATHTLGTSNQNWATLGTGIVKNTTTTGAISDAASADVIALWTGTCSSTTFLRGDGACAAASGGLPTGTTGQVIYYASGGTTGTATSALTITSASATGQIGFDNTAPVSVLDFLGTESHLGIGNVNTTLNGSITATSTSLTLTSGTGWSVTGGYATVMAASGGGTPEKICFSAVSGTTMTIGGGNCPTPVTTSGRSMFGTTAASHASGQAIYQTGTMNQVNSTTAPTFELFNGTYFFNNPSTDLHANQYGSGAVVFGGGTGYAGAFATDGIVAGGYGADVIQTTGNGISIANSNGNTHWSSVPSVLASNTSITSTSMITTGVSIGVNGAVNSHGRCVIAYSTGGTGTIQFGLVTSAASTRLDVFAIDATGALTNPFNALGITTATTTTISGLDTATSVTSGNFSFDFIINANNTNNTLTVDALTTAGAVNTLTIDRSSYCAFN